MYLFFIHSGLIELRASYLWSARSMGDKIAGAHGAIFGCIGGGSYFGDVSILLDRPITATVRAASTSMLYRLDKDCLLELLQSLPKADAYMRQIAEARLARVKLLDPDTPAAEWKVLSTRCHLMTDAEDARTELFINERTSARPADVERADRASRIVLPGMAVDHPLRGAGIVIEIDREDERGKPYKIKFDDAEVHHYSEHSLGKMTIRPGAETTSHVLENGSSLTALDVMGRFMNLFLATFGACRRRTPRARSEGT